MKKLGYGIYSKKQNIILHISIILFFIFIFTPLVCLFFDAINFTLLLLIYLSLFLLSFVVLFFSNPFLKIQSKLNKTANVNEYIKSIDQLMCNNLDEESIINLKLNKVNVLFVINKEEARELFDSIDKNMITKKDLVKLYLRIAILNRINFLEFDEARKLIEELRVMQGINNKMIDEIEMYIKILATKEMIPDIEKRLNRKTRLLFLNIVLASNLMYYYLNRIDLIDEEAKNVMIEKAKYVNDLINEKNLGMILLENDSKYILENYNK